MLEYWSLYNSSSKSILDVLERIYLIFQKTIVKRVTLVKLGVYDGGGKCFGGEVKVGTVLSLNFFICAVLVVSWYTE